MSVRIGTCGYSYYSPPTGWREAFESKLGAFADEYGLVEVNRTFYDLPLVSTAERWRREAGAANPDFEFTVKAWQALTHPTSSPTWKSTGGLSPAQREAFGYLRPEEPVVEAFRQTRAVAEALGADVVLLQTPPSFGPEDDHEANMRALLERVDRGDLAIAWEPRGGWHDHPGRVGAICDDLDLIHAVDPFRREPRSSHPWAYCRLHGRNEDPYDYDYAYDDDELAELAGMLEDLADGHERVYCLFNNYDMYRNARSLIELTDADRAP